MKKISKMQWENYKNSPRGQQVIAEFAKLCNNEVSVEEILSFCQKYNPQFFINHGPSDLNKMKNALLDFNDCITSLLAESNPDEEVDNAEFYHHVINELMGIEKDIVLPQGDYKGILTFNMLLTTILYCYMPELFLPNLWVMQYKYFVDITKQLEIELPKEPNHSNYLDRNLYYIDVNDAMFDYCEAEANGITEPAEICAFFYDYQATLIKEQIEEKSRELPIPAQAWFLVGKYGEIESNMKTGFWQASPETKRGDILVFYEKAPAKSINAIYRAKADGVVDPFFVFYSNTYISDKQTMPAITLDEFKVHPYFKDHKLIHKNFQGGSGWPLNSEDYNQLKQLWASKGYNISTLPTLMAHEFPKDVDFSEKEASVHKNLVLPLLAKMGWTEENGDILNQVVLHLGRGDAGKKGRTDISLHPYGENNKKAKVVIEEKYWMKNEKEVLEPFKQSKSYAIQSLANYFVLCDRTQIRVYPRQKDNDFDAEKYQVFYWDEMKNPDKFNELKKLLS